MKTRTEFNTVSPPRHTKDGECKRFSDVRAGWPYLQHVQQQSSRLTKKKKKQLNPTHRK